LLHAGLLLGCSLNYTASQSRTLYSSINNSFMIASNFTGHLTNIYTQAQT
jgi:hypothetical protein